MGLAGSQAVAWGSSARSAWVRCGPTILLNNIFSIWRNDFKRTSGRPLLQLVDGCKFLRIRFVNPLTPVKVHATSELVTPEKFPPTWNSLQ